MQIISLESWYTCERLRWFPLHFGRFLYFLSMLVCTCQEVCIASTFPLKSGYNISCHRRVCMPKMRKAIHIIYRSRYKERFGAFNISLHSESWSLFHRQLGPVQLPHSMIRNPPLHAEASLHAEGNGENHTKKDDHEWEQRTSYALHFFTQFQTSALAKNVLLLTMQNVASTMCISSKNIINPTRWSPRSSSRTESSHLLKRTVLIWTRYLVSSSDPR